MTIWSIKLRFQVNFLLTSYKTKTVLKKGQMFSYPTRILSEQLFSLYGWLFIVNDLSWTNLGELRCCPSLQKWFSCRTITCSSSNCAKFIYDSNCYVISGLQTKHFWVFTRRREYVNTHFRKVPKFSGLIRKENII